MLYLNWLLRVAMFIILLGFVVKNDQPVVLRYFFDYEWPVSLGVALLLFFAAGAILGMLSMLNKIFWQQREISRLKIELNQKNKSAGE